MQTLLNPSTAIVRAMPNTPAMVGQAITVWSQNAPVSAEQHTLVRN